MFCVASAPAPRHCAPAVSNEKSCLERVASPGRPRLWTLGFFVCGQVQHFTNRRILVDFVTEANDAVPGCILWVITTAEDAPASVGTSDMKNRLRPAEHLDTYVRPRRSRKTRQQLHRTCAAVLLVRHAHSRSHRGASNCPGRPELPVLCSQPRPGPETRVGDICGGVPRRCHSGATQRPAHLSRMTNGPSVVNRAAITIAPGDGYRDHPTTGGRRVNRGSLTATVAIADVGDASPRP